MPFPWKKTRATRISQIVADLQSPTRGGSLVVETGFPTSLVDLFVKHRDRLKKPSTRKKTKKKRSKHEIYDPITLRSSPSPPRPMMNHGGSAVSCTRTADLEIKNSKILEEAEAVGDDERELVRSPTETCVVGGGAAGGNNVCMVAVKMFVVAVLALSTKKLAVGITLSASLLLLLEFVGEHAVRFVKPCSSGKAVLKSLVVKVSRHLRLRKDNTLVQNLGTSERGSVPTASLSQEDASMGSPELRSSIEEIQLAEPKVNTGERPEGTGDQTHQLDSFWDKKRWDCSDGEKKTRIAEENSNGIELRVCENQRGTRGKLNGRIFKKLVPKKSSTSVIEKNSGKELELRLARSDHLGVDKMLVEEQVNEEENENQEHDLETRNVLPEKEEDSRKVSGVDEHWQAVEAQGSLSYLILVLIVLAGLFGGRILAVMLTIGGCFVFKLLEIPRTTSLSLPLAE